MCGLSNLQHAQWTVKALLLALFIECSPADKNKNACYSVYPDNDLLR